MWSPCDCWWVNFCHAYFRGIQLIYFHWALSYVKLIKPLVPLHTDLKERILFVLCSLYLSSASNSHSVCQKNYLWYKKPVQHVWFKLHDHGRIVFLNWILHSELFSARGHFQFATYQKYSVQTVVLLTTHIFSKPCFSWLWVWRIMPRSPGFLNPTGFSPLCISIKLYLNST